jgi:hypothetical protein
VDKKAAKKAEKAQGSEGRLLSYLRRSGTRKGFMGDSKPWLYIGAATWAYRLLRRLAQRNPEILLLEELKPGQRIIVANDRPTVDVG